MNRSQSHVRMLAAVFPLIVLVALSSDTVKAQVAGSAEKQLIYAPIADVEGFDHTEILIVNRMATATPVLVTVYLRDGKAYPTNATLSPNETRRLNIRNLVPSERRSIGGLSLEFTGQIMGISGQITIWGPSIEFT